MSADGHLDPVRQTMRRHEGIIARENLNPGKPFFGFNLAFKSMKYEALPPTEFRLPAFGLPDLAEPAKKGASNLQPYWLFALAAVGCVVAGGLRYIAACGKRS